MTEEFFGYLVYSTMALAAIALLWTERCFIKRLVKKALYRKAATSVLPNEYDTVMKKEAIQFALSWKDDNHGSKQDENVYRENGKTISKSETYKNIRKKVFE
jgi:hypothetical protein